MLKIVASYFSCLNLLSSLFSFHRSSGLSSSPLDFLFWFYLLLRLIGSASLRPDHWIEQMKPFIQFIHNVTLEGQERPVVKVAVLDDGASLDKLQLNNGKGQSFRVDNGEYWVSPCEHGTEMVACIRKLCPMAQLYIGRLDDSGVAEKQKFTTESCFKVRENIPAQSSIRATGTDINSMRRTNPYLLS